MSSSRSSASPINNNSVAIRQEITRFESVHPSIYAIYDLIESVADKNVYEQIRDHVVCIEDSFVNSQEWTLSRSVPEVKLGILGSIHSGKSALVHRYLTGSYMQDESPEGGRFKKEVVLEGQSFLLLIRDEGGLPDVQFSRWVDGVIFVFSLENEDSFRDAYDYYAHLANFRNTAELPIILVGTQDAISESNPRLIDDSRARKLASDLRRCAYYETCATYGLNVERVFQDACYKIHSCNQHRQPSRPTTPQHAAAMTTPRGHYTVGNNCQALVPVSNNPVLPLSPTPPPLPPQREQTSLVSLQSSKESLGVQSRDKLGDKRNRRTGDLPGPPSNDSHEGSTGPPSKANSCSSGSTPQFSRKANKSLRSKTATYSNTTSSSEAFMSDPQGGAHHYSEYNSLLTSRDRSSFGKKSDDEKEKKVNGIGSGRAIPVKQGYLYKRSTKALNKEWRKKKYVTLTEDARLTYHSNMHDYMVMVKGKEIDLRRTTVKIPGVAFRQSGTRPNITSNGLIKTQLCEANANKAGASPSDNVVIANDSMTSAYLTDLGLLGGGDSGGKSKDAAGIKKRHRRAKSTTKTNPNDGYESDGYEFIVISMDNQQWHFEAGKQSDRNDWVSQIESIIHNSLQLNESGKSKALVTASDPVLVRAIRNVAGNDVCADCGEADPDWASLNLGALVCIECSGVHRQLGTHISRVRSLGFDDWPPEHLSVMRSIGNTLANSVWEAAVAVNRGNLRKPQAASSREEKETWIRAKYEQREFLPPVPYPDAPIQQQLIDAMARQDTRQVILCLALAFEDVNVPYSKQDPRAAIHIAATLGNIVYIQLLLWYNGNPAIVDHEGRNAYFYAQASSQFECAEFLRSNGCPEQHMKYLGPTGVTPMHQQQHSFPVMSSQHPNAGVMATSAATLPRRRPAPLLPSNQQRPTPTHELGL